jgi:hypothetical protein
MGTWACSKIRVGPKAFSGKVSQPNIFIKLFENLTDSRRLLEKLNYKNVFISFDTIFLK